MTLIAEDSAVQPPISRVARLKSVALAVGAGVGTGLVVIAAGAVAGRWT